MTRELVKDALGLLGTLLTLVPFINDFYRRLAVKHWAWLGKMLPGLRHVTDKHQAAEAARVAEPSLLDIGLITAGIILLCGSFAVSLWISVEHASIGAPH